MLRRLFAVLSGLAAGLAALRAESALPATPPPESEMAAYLLVYFKDDTHGIHFALSSDGYTFADVNGGKPVFPGEDLAEQKGIRDPYITRGPDNLFYMAMTDLHIFARKAGHRETEWQRDGHAYGWGNNRALVLMKSRDLLHWERAGLRVDQAFPGLADIGCAWAPSLIYDHDAKRMLMTFTMRFGNGRNALYWSHLSPDFTRLETEPRQDLHRQRSRPRRRQVSPLLRPPRRHPRHQASRLRQTYLRLRLRSALPRPRAQGLRGAQHLEAHRPGKVGAHV